MEKEIIGIYYPIDYERRFDNDKLVDYIHVTCSVPIQLGRTGTDYKISHIRDNLYDCWNNKNHTEN